MDAELDDQERSLDLMMGGAELVGALGGAGLGLIGGPPGALAGAASGVVLTRALKRVGNEVHRRILSPRQRVRVGAAFHVAAEEIERRLRSGERPRDDGFFESSGEDRAEAESLLEGTLLAAQDAYDEKKVALLGRLYAGVTFDASIDPSFANYLLSLARTLTYAQFVAMAAIWEGAARDRAANASAQIPPRSLAFTDDVSLQIDDLERRGMISRGEPGGTHKRGGATLVDAGSLSPTGLTLTGSGKRLYELLGLSSISEAEKRQFVERLATIGLDA